MIFHQNLAELIVTAKKKGINLVILELYRSKERQEELVKEGKSQTQNSLHLVGLAADLAVMKNGKPVMEDCEEYHILGQMWEEMGGIWGGRFKTLNDIYHFQIGTDMILKRIS